VRQGLNLIRSVDKPSKNCLFLDNLGIVGDVCRGRNGVLKLNQVCCAADILQDLLKLQLLTQRQQIDGFIAVYECKMASKITR